MEATNLQVLWIGSKFPVLVSNSTPNKGRLKEL